MNNYWISVDWDFFCQIPKEMDESSSGFPSYREAAWVYRDPKLTSVSDIYRSFWKTLHRMGLSFGKCRVLVSEDHMFAQHSFSGRSNGKDTILINFDAHHDLNPLGA